MSIPIQNATTRHIRSGPKMSETKCTNNKDTAEYVDNLLSNNFIPVTIMPTRITSYSASLIDHIYYFESPKNKEYVSVKTGNFLQDISDHLPNYLLLLNNKKQSKSPRPTVRIFSEKKHDKI